MEEKEAEEALRELEMQQRQLDMKENNSTLGKGSNFGGGWNSDRRQSKKGFELVGPSLEDQLSHFEAQRPDFGKKYVWFIQI